MKKTVSLLLFLFFVTYALGQQSVTIPKYQIFVEGGTGLGPSTFSGVLSLQADRYFGKNKRWIIGSGLRLTGFRGKNINFLSAPPQLASKEENVDTLLALKLVTSIYLTN